MRKLPKKFLYISLVTMFLILLISVIHPENYLYPNAISLVIVNEPQSKMEEQSEIQIEEELGKTRIFSISCEFVDKFMAKTEFKCSKISWKNLRNNGNYTF